MKNEQINEKVLPDYIFPSWSIRGVRCVGKDYEIGSFFFLFPFTYYFLLWVVQAKKE